VAGLGRFFAEQAQKKGSGAEKQCNRLSVDEVADVGEYLLTEFDAQQLRLVTGVEVLFEALEDGAGEIGLCAQHPEQGCAVGGELIVAGQTACGAEGERNGYGSGVEVSGSVGEEIHSHAGHGGTGMREAQ
jgi:hypothetical protein